MDVDAADKSHNSELSILTPVGYDNNRCGYCRSKAGSCSYYAYSKRLAPAFYQKLINRGWRRSGTTLYKPDLLHGCCPHYTIRLEAKAFKPTKDQRQAVNRFNKFVIGESYAKERTRLQPLSRAESKRRKQEWNLEERVHDSEASTLGELSTGIQPDHSLVVALEDDNFTEEKYGLFEHYQRKIHKEPPSRISRNGFRSFLCGSPLIKGVTHVADGKVKRLGTYHQCYRLDGKLVAVGVLDLVPDAVSAVYFMYHESIEAWSPGKLSALREASLAIEGGYQFYMMGYYIHSCPKMRYKGDFKPQYVLDPENYDWNELDDAMKRRMQKSGYVCMNGDRGEAEPSTKRQKCSETSGNSGAVTTIRHAGEALSKGSDAVSGIDQSDPTDSDGDDDDTDESKASMPLYSRNMPGVMGRADLEAADADGSLDLIKLMIQGNVHWTNELMAWDQGSIHDSRSLKGIICDLICALGLDLAEGMAVGFS